MLAKKITVQRINNLEPTHKEEFKKLSEIALVEVSKNYMLYPELKNLDKKYKLRVYDNMSVDFPVDITFPLIDHEPFWERSCKKEFGLVDCCQHGNSWKQCYAENYIKRMITNFDVSKGDKMEIIMKFLELFRYHIFNLEIPTFSADFQIEKIPQHFVNLTSLELKYSPVLREDKNKNINIFNKQLTPINDEYSKFGMRMVDLKHFAISLNTLNYLLSLTLQGNFLDDDMIIWLVSGLISNHSIRLLDLSNNKITDSGLIKLSSYLIRTTCLTAVDLTNNLIGGEGGFAISLVLKENTRLKVLKLGMNKIDDMNASKIFLSLGKNEYLEELDLSSNHLGDMVSNSLSYCFKNNKRLKVLDLSYSQVFLDSEAKNSLEQHPCLIKLDLHSTKCSEDEVKSLESILIRKSVKQNLAYKKLNKN